MDPMCPSCGHMRVGIPSDACCPECGAEGFGGAFVIHGTLVQSMLPLLVVAAAVPLFLYGIVAMTSMVGWFTLRGSVLVIVAAAVLTLLSVGLWPVFRARVALRVSMRVPAVWMVFPDSVVVRSGGSIRRIPRSAIKSIRCTDSFVGSTSQLMLVLGLFTSSARFGTPIIYIRGTKESRRLQWRKARGVLRLEE